MTTNTTPEQDKLNMGCGWKKLQNHWNVDIEPKCNPDQIVDLEQTPWPYDDDTFRGITAHDILQRLGQNPRAFVDIVKEMYRVSKHGSEWFINLPFYRSDGFWDDYANVRSITPLTFNMFDQNQNRAVIERGMSMSTYGLYHDVDLEIVNVDNKILPIWQERLDQGLLGKLQFTDNLYTLHNVVASLEILIRVHKPGRQSTYIANNR